MKTNFIEFSTQQSGYKTELVIKIEEEELEKAESITFKDLYVNKNLT